MAFKMRKTPYPMKSPIKDFKVGESHAKGYTGHMLHHDESIDGDFSWEDDKHEHLEHHSDTVDENGNVIETREEKQKREIKEHKEFIKKRFPDSYTGSTEEPGGEVIASDINNIDPLEEEEDNQETA
jgi:hypothetical protein